ncbi:hypothetical protein BRC92_01390 [Halobacteriales archaeon QS_4_69_31]|nr:MAG: hypothetical protein BRC92_01390 [Halobacteriales archaeon QS_4_69_31]
MAEGADGGESLGWRGWVLVAGLVVALVLAPWSLILLTEFQAGVSALGLGYRNTYLVVPLLPALGLGLLAVWAAVANRRND